MRLTRLSLLLVVLVLIMAAPQAFGGNEHGALGSSGANDQDLMCEEYWIYCNDGSTDTCCADLEGCLGYCERVCGGPCVYEGDA